jgi:hypothetical protein
MAGTYVNVLAISGTDFSLEQADLFAGTLSGGVWRRPLSEMVTSVHNLSPDAQVHFRLEQNYPNPFNPTTAVNFQLAARSKTKITLYDLLGREVAVLVDEVMNPGRYEARWDASGFPTGVYFCRIFAGTFTSTRRMLYCR